MLEKVLHLPEPTMLTLFALFALGSTELFSQWWCSDPSANFPTNRSDALRFGVQT